MSTYADKLLRVNLTRREVKTEVVPEQNKKDFMAGRGLCVKYLYDELAPGTDPLSPENKLLLSTGILAGTGAQGCSRWVVVTKSPISGAITKSVAGANFGPAIKFAGFDLIILEGKASKPAYVYIEDGKAQVLDAQDLWGLNTEVTQQRLKQRHGPTTQIACIGPAGEMLVRYASIVSERRTASRCGVGTVMGSKNLKAVAINGTGRTVPHYAEVFKELSREYIEAMKAHPRIPVMTSLGTANSVDKYSKDWCMTPVRNFQEGTLAGIDRISSHEFRKLKRNKYGCWGCMTKCGQWREVTEGPYAGALTEGPEYETIFALGCELCNSEIGFIVAADALCDLYGMDTISTGVSIGFATELFERGIITTRDTDGLELTWGNHAAFLPLVERIGKREGFGWLLGEGTKRAAEQIGKGADRYAMQVKGIELPGYEPRATKGYALSYAVSNIGSTHMYGRPWAEMSRKVDPLTEEGKGEMVASSQNGQAIDDSAIACNFGTMALEPELKNRLMAAATGIDDFGDPDKLERIGARIVCLERAFNVRDGFSRKDDTLPERFLTEPLRNAGPATGQIVRNLDGMIDELYDAAGYTREGTLSARRMEELGLS